VSATCPCRSPGWAARASDLTVTPGLKAELAASLGAQLCIDYRREDVGQKLRSWAGTDGADVVHDTVGGETFTACFSLVRPYGDLASNVESPWEDEAITAMHNRNLRVSFTWMPAPSVFGWPGHPGTAAGDPGTGSGAL
jgi:NADPH:quinone reductase